MLTYGDGVADIDLHRLLQHHVQSGKMATFTGIHPTSRFATVDLDRGGNVVSWEEKRRLVGYVNAGFFVLEPGIFDYIEGDCELEMEPMERLTREGQVNMYPHEGFWHCMDTYRDYEALSDLWRSPNPPWKHWQD
jgi:glucose-1-phosphate cytidylyltransferase